MSKKKTLNEFKKEIKKLTNNEYEIIDNKYINNKTKIKIRHNKCGYEYYVRPDRFINGDRCPKCGGKLPISTEEFKKKVYNLVRGEYTILGEYINCHTKIKIRHNKCGKIFESTPTHFLNNKTRCPYCKRKEITSILNNYNIKNAKLKIKSNKKFKKEVYNLVGNEYTILDKYIGCHTKIKIRHNKCGKIFKMTPSHFLNGERCPYCAKSNLTSYKENELYNYIKSLYNKKIISNDRTILNGKELDIYLPNKKLAIEFNGLYWHSNKLKNKNYHYNKTIKCNEKNIILIHIYENYWEKNKQAIKYLLHYIIQPNDYKFIIKKYSIKEINRNIKIKFCNKYGIYNKKSDINIGLYKNNKLISIITFKKENLNYIIQQFVCNNNFKYDLKLLFNILLQYFIKKYSNNILIKLDRNIFNNYNYFISNNFKYNKTIKPKYFMVQNKYKIYNCGYYILTYKK